MPILDTPITTDDNNLKNVLGQNIPVALYLYDSKKGADKPLDDTLKKAAKKQAGELLVVKVDVANNPNTRHDYEELDVPALVTSTKAMLGRKIKSQASRVRPADVRAHIDYLLERGPEPVAPSAKPANDTSSPKKKAKGPLHVTDGSFNQVVLKSKQPVLVDFWAPWCGPCRSIAPVIEEMAQTYAGQVRVVKVNTDENPGISRRFQIQAIPTLMMFRNGKPIERRSGGNRQLIRSMIEESLR